MKVLTKDRRTYTGHDGLEKEELLLVCESDTAFPDAVFRHTGQCFLRAEGKTVKLRIPVVHEELKLFFDNIEDYYYLPDDDMAVHKSVSEFVDKSRRKKATKKNCYIRKEGVFLPVWSNDFSSVFKRNYNDTVCYVLLDDIEKSAAWHSYAAHVTDIILNSG